MGNLDPRFLAPDGRYLEREAALHDTGRRRRPAAHGRSSGRTAPLPLLRVPRVIDVSQYARRGRQSGIPRIVRALITADAARTYVPVVWDRGALCPVEVDADGAVRFPRENWRRGPGTPLAERLHPASTSARCCSGACAPPTSPSSDENRSGASSSRAD